MKAIILAALMLLSVGAAAQTEKKFQVNGNVITSVKADSKRESKPAEKTAYVYKDSQGKTYPVYKSAKGKMFVNKVSSKTGKTYKMYIKL